MDPLLIQLSLTSTLPVILGKVNSVQEACTKCFAVHILKFEILQMTWKKETKNIRLLVVSFSSIVLVFWGFLFYFFMWFARFQILICEPQSLCDWKLLQSWSLVLLFQYFLRLWFFSGASDTVSFVTKSCEPDKPAPAKLVRFFVFKFQINWLSQFIM